MQSEEQSPTGATPTTDVRRRTITKGLAWSVPALAGVAAAPATAASLQIVPGINGWNINRYSSGYGFCSHQIAVDSQPSDGPPTADGAPYGLYLYDVTPGTTIADAKMTYWIRGNTSVTWTSQPGHSSCWGSPVRGAPQSKSDGALYTPYTWTYTCSIDPANVAADGRLYLARFRTTASFTLADGICNMVCFWAQRQITVNGELQQFERKRGFAGCSGQSVNRMAQPQAEGVEGESDRTDEERAAVVYPDASVAG